MNRYALNSLSSIADVISGFAFKSIWFGSGSNKIVRISDLVNHEISLKSTVTFDVNEHPVATRYQIQDGDILVALSGATTGKIGVATTETTGAYVNQRVAIVRGFNKHNGDYLRYILQSSYMKNLLPSAEGAAQPNLSPKLLESLEIPIPPIREQRRIAAQLKAQLAEVDKARQAAEMQLRDVKILSIALLREIFSGDYLSQYPAIPLGDVGEVVSGITLGRKISQKNINEKLRQVSYLRVANVKDGFLDLAEVKTIGVTETEIEKWRLQKGDILLTEGGDPDKLGRGTFWSEELPECIHQNHIFRVRFPQESYLPEFIAAQIGSPYGKDYFFTHAKKTTGIATINQKVLKAFPLQSPELDVQKKIMASLYPRLRDTQTACESIKQQIQAINLLPQKILAQAFEN